MVSCFTNDTFFSFFAGKQKGLRGREELVSRAQIQVNVFFFFTIISYILTLYLFIPYKQGKKKKRIDLSVCLSREGSRGQVYVNALTLFKSQIFVNVCDQPAGGQHWRSLAEH